ncbi:MAG: rhodanese-like domain-containing protein [Bacteroidota bacterium]|nr:rhodanese-like domain-containing protein [Bacteroidota bacterium]MDP4232941.1 rhodanese-like domain-containing protein [Bacteroidota bacterium]MDP4241985.1 rhodanese-like domain-containing protein [Bacteroidota bacterium]MDP4286888.1 rhodanese-like domain-containing protein [Bacteroidota bacterium]
MQIPFEITVHELKEWRDQGREFTLIDVREPSEYNIANIGGKLIPLNSLPQHLAEFDPEAEIVVHCKLGGRSGMAVEFMRRNGFPKTRNLRGGIIAWSKEIDKSVVQY